MKAVVMTGYGGNEVIEVRDMPKPQIRSDEILVQVHSASVNPLDFKIRDGKLKVLRKYRFPQVIGNDLAGTVVEIGRGATNFKVGDSVYARVDKATLGAFAEYAAVKASDLALKPEILSMEEAAAIPLAALTAWQALFDVANVQRGQKVFISAGAGGVGSVAIQLAKGVGAQVATTASGSGIDLVKRLGADVVIDYKRDQFEEELNGYDAVLDLVGGDTLERSFRILKPGGIVVSVAGKPEPGTAKSEDAGALIAGLFWLMSLKLRNLAARYKVRYVYHFMRPSGEQLGRIAAIIDGGRLKPVIDQRFPLEKAKDALAYVEGGRAKGKVLIRVSR